MGSRGIWKLGFSTVIGKLDKGRNGINAFFFITICEQGGSYTKYQKLLMHKICGSVKCECLFRVRGYLLIDDHLSLKVGNSKHNPEMENVLKSHKISRSLNPNEIRYLRE